MTKFALCRCVLTSCCIAAMSAGCCYWQPHCAKKACVPGLPSFQGEQSRDFLACESMANEAWEQVVHEQTPGCTSDFFHRGFVQGYLSSLRCLDVPGPPPLPLGRGWQAGYCQASGATAIQEWRDGFSLGAAIARTGNSFALDPNGFITSDGHVESGAVADGWSGSTEGWGDDSAAWQQSIARVPEGGNAESIWEVVPTGPPAEEVPSSELPVPALVEATAPLTLPAMAPLPLGSTPRSPEQAPPGSVQATPEPAVVPQTASPIHKPLSIPERYSDLPQIANEPATVPPVEIPVRRPLAIPEGHFDSPKVVNEPAALPPVEIPDRKPLAIPEGHFDSPKVINKPATVPPVEIPVRKPLAIPEGQFDSPKVVNTPAALPPVEIPDRKALAIPEGYFDSPHIANERVTVPPVEVPDRKPLAIPEGYFESPPAPADRTVAPPQAGPQVNDAAFAVPPTHGMSDSPSVSPVNYTTTPEDRVETTTVPAVEIVPNVPASISTVRPEVWRLFKRP